MRRQWLSRPRWHALAFFWLLAAAAPAAENDVVVACDALTSDEAAELDARTRATLLADGPEGTQVRLRCEAELATVIAVTGDASESAVVHLPNASLKDALLAAVDRTLAAAKERAQGASATFAAEPLPEPPPLPTPPATAAVRADDSVDDSTIVPPAPERPTHFVRLGAGALFTTWNAQPAYGGRARVEVAFPPWSVALALGGLTSAERAESFVPSEWHALAVGALDLEAVAGLRLSAGAGVSVLLASPSSGLANESGTASTAALFELGLSRPLRAGHVIVTPELDLRLFSGRREVKVDGTTQMTVPIASPLLALTFAYEL